MSSTEFTFIECSSQSAFEINDENNKFITRIDGGIVIPENSRITIESAFVNVLGADSDVIELTGRKVGDNKYYEFVNSSSTYEETSSEVFDNKVTLQLEYYKNDDMNYCFPANYPYYNYVGDFPTMTVGKNNYTYQLCPKGINKIDFSGATGFLTDENETGVNSSTDISVFGYNFPHDNRRYTICERYEFTKYDNSSAFNGIQRHGRTYARDVSFYEYYVFHKPLEITVTKGQNTASSVAEQISQQLTKISEPKILNGKAWGAEPANATDPWIDSADVNFSTVMSNPTFTLVNCANRRSFWQGANHQFYKPGTNNTNIEAFIYQDNFESIGIYDPDVFISGRNVNRDDNFADKGFVHYLTDTVPLTPNASEIVLKTSIPYDEDILRTYHNLFEFQVANPDFWKNLLAVSNTEVNPNLSPLNSVFLHIETLDYNTSTIDDYYTTPFGSDKPNASGGGGTYNQEMTNAIYLKYQPEYKDVFGENLAFGVFTRRDVGSPAGKVSYCNITAYVNLDATGKSTFYDLPMSQVTQDPITPSGLPDFSSPLNIRRIGWDRHFSALGNQSIILYNGLISQSNLQVNTPGKDVSGTLSDFAPRHIYNNSFINPNDSKEYFYDTAIKQIYVGSDSCQLGFDLNESRFIFSNFHTPRSENNTGISAFDSAVMPLIPVVSQTGTEAIFYPDSTKTAIAEQIEIPLTANPNANTAIYQISPSDLAENTNSIYGLTNLKNGNADGLKTNTIFDSMTGCFIASFGIDSNTYKGSLFEILGFSFNQLKSYLQDDFYTHFPLNRNARKLNQGVNIIDTIEYPFTTNADIQANEIRTWRTNPFGVSYFNTLTPPSNMRVIQGSVPASHTGIVTYSVQTDVKKYEVTQNQTSSQMFAERLASKTLIPFYQIRSDILQDQFQYFGGNKNTSGRLPCVTMVNKSEPGADYYSQSSSGIEYIIKKRLVINNVVTEIYDNVGRLAKNIAPFSSIIYRIEKMYNPPAQSIPFSTILEMEQAQLEKENEKKKK